MRTRLLIAPLIRDGLSLQCVCGERVVQKAERCWGLWLGSDGVPVERSGFREK